jgi:hypothetical protein
LSCPSCGEATGKNYAHCHHCHDAVERFWLADWHAFLDHEQILPESADERLVAQIVLDEGERHPWTLIDGAMTLLICNTCGNELGGGPSDCTECASAWGVALWSETVAGRNGLVTFNEHALHVGRMILRFPHRQSANIIAAWSRTMPRLLTGWLPTTGTAQNYMDLIKAGRLAEVDAYLAELDRAINTAAQ